MKKLKVLITGLLLCMLSTNAQEKTTELSLRTNFDSSSFIFKKGNSRSLWRIGLNGSYSKGKEHYNFNFIDIGGNYFTNTESDNKSYSFGAFIGKEWRTKINSELHFVYGADVGIDFGSSESKRHDDTTFTHNSDSQTYYSALVIGVNYAISQHFMIGLELNPSLNYHEYEWSSKTVDSSSSSEGNDLNTDLNLNSARLSVTFRL